jgi:dTDP-4-dehydrorhamnose 3,5-epimerase
MGGLTMRIADTAISGVRLVETDAFRDERGTFMRAFCARELAPILEKRTIAQANISRTTRPGAIRGLHFQQPPHAEMKMVRCLRGRVWDVALDLRKNSPTFLKWHAEELTPGNMKMLTIPEGCAHGFQTLEPESEVSYFSTAFYEPSAEGAVRYDDPRAAIRWPLPATDLSNRDAAHPLLAADFKGLTIP